MNRLNKSRLVIIITFIFAIAMTIMPLPFWVSWFRPLWMMMVLVYWSLGSDIFLMLENAFFTGILLDVLGGTLLGEHAIVLILCVYIVTRFKRQIRMYSFSQQALLLLFLSFLYQGIIFLIEGFVGHIPSTLLFWMPLLTTSLLWPWLFIILQDCRRRFKVT